jgi:hypothetical protein
MTPQDAALRVTVLDALSAMTDAELARARKDAEAAFKAAVDGTGFRASTGALQVEVTLPGGRVIGHVSVKAGAKTSVTDEVGLHEWCAERNTEALEEYALPEAGWDERVVELLQSKCPDLLSAHLKPGALEDPRVLDLLRAEIPEFVSSRVRPGALKAYVKEAARNTPKGWLSDPETGEGLHLVKEAQEPPSGAFAFNGAETAERRAAVVEALIAGDRQVRAIAFGGMLAIPPGGDDGE